MLKNNVCKNELVDEGEFYLNLNSLVDIRESVEFKEASDAFEHYLEDYARATRMPQSILTDICHLAAQTTQKAIEFYFMKGFEIGSDVMRSVLEEDAARESGAVNKKSYWPPDVCKTIQDGY